MPEGTEHAGLGFTDFQLEPPVTNKACISLPVNPKEYFFGRKKLTKTLLK
jgi:hypothetical protein